MPANCIGSRRQQGLALFWGITRRIGRSANGEEDDTHMGERRPRPWVHSAAVLGTGYALVGVLFALPTTHAKWWRLAAWMVSALGYAAQILYERVRLRNSAGLAALHVAFAAALGAFGLAVGANIHSLSVGSSNQQRQLLLLSLGIWPMITALPAFLVALGAGALLARAFGTAQSASGDRSSGLTIRQTKADEIEWRPGGSRY